MLSTLLLKEIHETIITYRFLIATLLCLILIPLGMYVSLNDYQQRYNEYQDSVRLYEERAKGNIGSGFQAEGYHPPSALSVFSLGFKHTLPYKVITSADGELRIETKTTSENSESVLFGEVDFVFIMSFVLSILALIFTFNSISGEKELGSLRLVLSNAVSRWKIILAKILGNYIVLLVPFFIGGLISLLVIVRINAFALFSREIFPSVMMIFLLSIVFLFAIFNLGIFLSTRTRNSITSIIISLFIWVIFVLVVPKVSSMIARVVYPIKAHQIVTIEKQMVKSSIEKEFDNKRKTLMEGILVDNGLDPQNVPFFSMSENPAVMKSLKQYDEEVIPLETEYRERISNAVKKIEQDYQNKKNTQTAISINLARISPICSFTHIVSEISGTGTGEIENFTKNAQQFQQQVADEIYNNYSYKKYLFGGMGIGMANKKDEGFDEKKIAVPHLVNYKHITLTQALRLSWVDILILLLFGILLFAASFVSFLRYDVR
jgi:ABC-type transport system involved in multi-copper enzyme maturation permease subunit